jgi:uncharacterized cupin superfamily protein
VDQKRVDSTVDGGDARFQALSRTEAFWRASNQMGVQNTDLGKQLRTESLGARLWRLGPGQASTKHRHPEQEELYFLLEGTGRIRIDDEVLTLDPQSAVAVAAPAIRQLFNDTAEDALWLVVGAPRESPETIAERIEYVYPDGPKALPPELS